MIIRASPIKYLERQTLYDIFRYFGRIEFLKLNIKDDSCIVGFDLLSSALLALRLKTESILIDNEKAIQVEFAFDMFNTASFTVQNMTQQNFANVTEYLKNPQKTFAFCFLFKRNKLDEIDTENLHKKFNQKRKTTFLQLFAFEHSESDDQSWILGFVEFEDDVRSGNEVRESQENSQFICWEWMQNESIQIVLQNPWVFVNMPKRTMGGEDDDKTIASKPPSTRTPFVFASAKGSHGAQKHQPHPDNKKNATDVFVSPLYSRQSQ